MPLMPMMPTGDPMSSPNPGQPSDQGMPPGGPDSGGGLMSMLMGAGAGDPNMGGAGAYSGAGGGSSDPTMGGEFGGGEDPMMGGGEPPMGSTVPSPDQLMAGGVQSQMLQIQQQIMGQFQQIEQMVMDLSGMLPGTEQIAEDILMDFDLWKRQAVMTLAQPAAAMPGAAQMI